MKTIFKISVVLALMSTTTSSMANDPKISLVPGNDAKSIILELEDQIKASTLRLTDADNNPIFFENTRENRYAKKFNLEKLANGTYFFAVKNPLQSVIFTLNLKDTEVKIVDRAENNPKTVFRKAGDKIYLNLMNQKEADVAILIMDDQDRVIFNETVGDEFIVQKTFNFESAIKGRYTVTVKNGTNTYHESIVIG